MKQEKLKILASELWNLEQKCQNGEEISENMDKMMNIANKLSITELLQLADFMESSNCKI